MDPFIGQIQAFGTLTLDRPTGRTFDTPVFLPRKDSGEAHLDYLTVTLQN